MIGLDWRSPLDEAWQRIGYDRGVQGNLEPALLLGPWERVERAAEAIIKCTGGRPGHIFNLGHGVLPVRSRRPQAARRVRPRTDALPREGRRRPHGLRQPRAGRGHRPTSKTSGRRPVSDAAVEELTERYRRIGGRSPLDEMTERQRAALEAELGVPVFVGMKHWQPRIADAVEEALAGGAETIVGLVLAPHYRAVDRRLPERLEAAVAGRGRAALRRALGTHEPYLDALAERVQGFDGHVVFTAHSLPARILDEGDPYQDELLETSRLIAERAARPGHSPIRARARPASLAGPGHPGRAGRTPPAGSSACSSARSASSTTSRSSGTSTSKRENGPASWVSSSTGSIPERRPRSSEGWRPRFSTLDHMKTGEIVAEKLGRQFRVYPHRNSL